ncbi:hypothetical protein VCH24_00800 [Variovorax boronicumulans]|nr:hypothetical protein VCH24_00800 [Variovorax boronicumulans]
MQARIGDGAAEGRKEITADAVYSAVLGGENFEAARNFGGSEEPLRLAHKIDAQARSTEEHALSQESWGGNKWVYYGAIRDGKPDGFGSTFFSSGYLERGQYSGLKEVGRRVDNGQPLSTPRLHGIGDNLMGGSARFVGGFADGARSGQGFYRHPDGEWMSGVWRNNEFEGTWVRKDGTRFEGSSVSKPGGRQRVQGREYRADGALIEEGRYENGKLSVGTLYDAAGVRTEVDLPAQRQAATERAQQMATGSGSSNGSGSTSERPRPLPSSAAFSKDNSRYSSICMRNAAKAEQAISAANARRYFGGGVDLDIFDMAKRIAQPCMAYDSKAKWAYDDAEQARINSQCRSSSCSRWPEGETGSKTRQWFEIFSGEFNKMMTNWESYSSDLDPPSGGRTSGVTRSAAGRLSSQQCEAMRQIVITTKVPAGASVTASTETVMLLTKTAMDMIDGDCQGTSMQDRQEHQAAYLAAERACNQVQSGGRRDRW